MSEMRIPDHLPDPPQPGDVDFHGHRYLDPAPGQIFCAGGCGYPVARPGLYCGECTCEDDDCEQCVHCASKLCPSCGGCWCEGNRCHRFEDADRGAYDMAPGQ